MEVLTLLKTKETAVRRTRMLVAVMEGWMIKQASSLHLDFLQVWGCPTSSISSKATLVVQVLGRMDKMVSQASKRISNSCCSSKCNFKICISIRLDQMEIRMRLLLVEDRWMFTRMHRIWDRRTICIRNRLINLRSWLMLIIWSALWCSHHSILKIKTAWHIKIKITSEASEPTTLHSQTSIHPLTLLQSEEWAEDYLCHHTSRAI